MEPEYIDRLDVPDEVILGEHRKLEVLNRVRGYGPILRALRDVSGPVLDVGAGTGGLLRRHGGRRRRHGGVGLERHPAAAAEMCRRGVPAVVGDARRLPFRSGTFAAAVSLLTLHHLDDAGAVASLAEMRRVAPVVVVSDLAPSPGILAAARFLLPRLPIAEAARFDFIASFERARPPERLRRLALAAGLAGVRIRRLFPGRLILLGR